MQYGMRVKVDRMSVRTGNKEVRAQRSECVYIVCRDSNPSGHQGPLASASHGMFGVIVL